MDAPNLSFTGGFAHYALAHSLIYGSVHLFPHSPQGFCQTITIIGCQTLCNHFTGPHYYHHPHYCIGRLVPGLARFVPPSAGTHPAPYTLSLLLISTYITFLSLIHTPFVRLIYFLILSLSLFCYSQALLVFSTALRFPFSRLPCHPVHSLQA